MTTAKILNRKKLVELRGEAVLRDRTVGFTSGTFDLLHPGHVEYLERAKELCDLLIVGVNSDRSVREYKGEDRPICPEDDRIRVLAGLESVDYLFLFDEPNNNKNIELLKPDIYIKAGDYDRSRLTSAPIVESYGGRVELVPMTGQHSTTAVINRILEGCGASNAVCEGGIPKERRPALFVDRDGTINEEVEYLHDPKAFRLISGAIEGLKLFSDAGFRIVVVTNQPGIGLGYYSKNDFFRVNKELLKAAGKAGVMIDKVYFCPHSKAENCECRKPKTAMIDRAVRELNLDLSKSYFIGDMTSDVAAGQIAGCKTVLVKTGHAGLDGLHDVRADIEAVNLLEAAKKIVAGKGLS